MSYIPQRGHFIRLNFDLQAGHRGDGIGLDSFASREVYHQPYRTHMLQFN